MRLTAFLITVARIYPDKKGYPRFKHNNRPVDCKVSGWKLDTCRKWIIFTDKKNIGTLKLIDSRDIYFYQIVP